MTCHDRHQRTRGQIFVGEAIGEVRNSEPRFGGSDQSRAVVGLKPPLRMNRDDLVAIHELPGFGALHESLMRNELLGRLRRAMRLDIARTGDELPVDWSDPPCEQVGVLEIADPYRTIVTLRDEIDEAITIAGVDVEPRVVTAFW